MRRVVQFVHFYHFFPTVILRFLIEGALVFVLILGISKHTFPTTALSLLLLFGVLEVFVRYKLRRVQPTVALSQNTGDFYDSCTFSAASALIQSSQTLLFLHTLFSYPSVRFVLQKAVIQQQEIKSLPISEAALRQKLEELLPKVHASFVASMDVLVAYLLLTEAQTKLLFSKKLKEEDIFMILMWAREEFKEEEHPKPPQVALFGAGIGDSLVSGWTLETKKYTKDITSQCVNTVPSVIGREAEYKRLIDGLSKKESNNVMLIGETGVGKDDLVHALAYESFMGHLPHTLQYKRVYELSAGRLIAGATNRNDLEERIQTLMEELSHVESVIVYIPQFQDLVGSSSFNIDLSGALLPFLQHDKFPIIASISSSDYKTYLEHNPILEVFEQIKLEEPDPAHAQFILFTKIDKIEREENVIVSYLALKKAIELSHFYLRDMALPKSALKLLTTTGHRVAQSKEETFDPPAGGKRIVSEEHIIKQVEQMTHVAIATPQEAEKELLLHLEDKMHERVIDQVEAITVISEAMRRLRAGLKTSQKPISFLFLGPTGVGKTETAKALADLYYGGEKQMARLDMSEYQNEDSVKRLLGAEPGQGSERGDLTEKIADHPFCLLLLDEFEKAHPKILDLFLQVLDDGRLTDNKGRTVSFGNVLLIATSNAAAEFVREEVGKGTVIDKAFHQKLLSYLQEHNIFKPELLNRFDEVITFKPLGQEEVVGITKLLLVKLSKTLKEKDIALEFNEQVVAKIAQEGFDRQFGARPLRRFIQDNLEDQIAQRMIKNEIERGSKVTVSVDSNNNFVFLD